LFDRHIVHGLRARGRTVGVVELSGRGSSGVLADLSDGAKTVIDGLALANLAETVAAQARRLRIIAFVHGPLARETSLSPAAANGCGRRRGRFPPAGLGCPRPEPQNRRGRRGLWHPL